jgi:hypothetical protein
MEGIISMTFKIVLNYDERASSTSTRASKRLSVGDGGNLLVGLATFSYLLAVASSPLCPSSLQGDRTSSHSK